MWILSLILLPLLSDSSASPVRFGQTVVSKMRMADLESSASGYSYNQQPGLPVSFVQYTNHGHKHYFDAPKPSHFVSTPQPRLISPLSHQIYPTGVFFANPSLSLPNAPQEPHHQPVVASEYSLPVVQIRTNTLPNNLDVEAEANKRLEVHEDSHDFDDEDDDVFDHDEFVLEEPHGEIYYYHQPETVLENHIPGSSSSYGDVYDSPGYAEAAKYELEKYGEYGVGGEKGYKGHHEFDHGDQAEYDNDDHKGHYNDEKAHEHAHSKSAGHYGEHEEGNKGEHGSSHSQTSYHKKGHKTTGFHNVYHKDEYKKDTEFYDEDHNSGHFDDHSSADGHHHAAQSGYKKGNHHDTEYAHSDQGKAGHSSKGHDYSDHQGHKAQAGEDSYHKQLSDYAKKGGSISKNKHDYEHGYGLV